MADIQFSVDNNTNHCVKVSSADNTATTAIYVRWWHTGPTPAVHFGQDGTSESNPLTSNDWLWLVVPAGETINLYFRYNNAPVVANITSVASSDPFTTGFTCNQTNDTNGGTMWLEVMSVPAVDLALNSPSTGMAQLTVWGERCGLMVTPKVGSNGSLNQDTTVVIIEYGQPSEAGQQPSEWTALPNVAVASDLGWLDESSIVVLRATVVDSQGGKHSTDVTCQNQAVSTNSSSPPHAPANMAYELHFTVAGYSTVIANVNVTMEVKDLVGEI